MKKDTLIFEIMSVLQDDAEINQFHVRKDILKLIDEIYDFNKKYKNSICLDVLRFVEGHILEESFHKGYIVRKNAMFGDLVEIRKIGFERRYLYNVKICKTYKSAYEKTEEEYIQNFGRRRYSSYDSFRQVRKRYLKNK